MASWSWRTDTASSPCSWPRSRSAWPSAGHEFHRKLHDFAEELERLLMMVLLVGFGAGLVAGGILSGLTWQAGVYTLLAILVVRPLCGWISLLGSKQPPGEAAVISFFGIRGLGTIYYLAYGLGPRQFRAGGHHLGRRRAYDPGFDLPARVHRHPGAAVPRSAERARYGKRAARIQAALRGTTAATAARLRCQSAIDWSG
jgi:hypothetical protein